MRCSGMGRHAAHSVPSVRHASAVILKAQAYRCRMAESGDDSPDEQPLHYRCSVQTAATPTQSSGSFAGLAVNRPVPLAQPGAQQRHGEQVAAAPAGQTRPVVCPARCSSDRTQACTDAVSGSVGRASARQHEPSVARAAAAQRRARRAPARPHRAMEPIICTCDASVCVVRRRAGGTPGRPGPGSGPSRVRSSSARSAILPEGIRYNAHRSEKR